MILDTYQQQMTADRMIAIVDAMKRIDATERGRSRLEQGKANIYAALSVAASGVVAAAGPTDGDVDRLTIDVASAGMDAMLAFVRAHLAARN